MCRSDSEVLFAIKVLQEHCEDIQDCNICRMQSVCTSGGTLADADTKSTGSSN